MAIFEIKGLTEMELKLSKLGTREAQAANEALYAGAAIMCNAVRQNLENIREELPRRPGVRYRYLQPGESYTGVPTRQKRDLLAGLGITPVRPDKNGDPNIKIGFEAETDNARGYDSQPTRKYPKGRPLMMLARSIESGTSIQPKEPFFRPAVEETKEEAVEAMNRVVNAALEQVK